MNETAVAIIRAENYDVLSVKEKLEDLIGTTGFPAVEGKCVLIKPNVLSDAHPEKAITTNPAVVEALAIVLEERGAAKIMMGDSPGLHTPGFAARNSGLAAVCERRQVEWQDFSKDNRSHRLTRRISAPMAAAIDMADVVISVAKMKTHQLMYMTGCVKNMFGLVPGLNKSPMHLKAPSREQFAKVIVSIFKESHTDYAILDGIVAMEGPGPANGYPKRADLLLASRDAFAVDRAASVIMGYDPETIPILREGEKQGLTDPALYTYPILRPEDVAIKDFARIEQKKSNLFVDLIMPIFLRPFRMSMIRRRPAPQFMDNCIRCKRCISICPATALHMENGKVVIDKSLCIRCYCCHEMCPVDAIKVPAKT